MARLRPILAALLALWWLPAANCCLLAAALPSVAVDCCPTDGADRQGEQPDGADCDKCVALKSGMCLSYLEPFSVDAPALLEHIWLSSIFSAELAAAAEEAPAFSASPPPALQLWPLLVRTALPVRGPSLV